MNAEIIAVGSEMLTHKRVDTNSLFLTEQLNNLGIEVTAKHVIGDDLERLAETIRRALGAAPLAHDADHARTATDLTVYLRQHHAERDYATLGQALAAREWDEGR